MFYFNSTQRFYHEVTLYFIFTTHKKLQMTFSSFPIYSYYSDNLVPEKEKKIIMQTT